MKTAVITAPAGGHDGQRIRRRRKLNIRGPRQHHFIHLPCGNRLSCLFNQRMPLRIVRGVLFAEHRRQSGGLRLIRR
ncbi:Uncharacterised protein [Raoultella ornithinolytica]|nr:Uncharacterised protein [Raoultella ornithinolytica]